MPVAVNSCNRVVGRLLEIRVDAGYWTPEDVDAMIAMINSVYVALQEDEQVIIAADWRHCTILGQQTAERALAMLSNANPRALRSSILLMPSSPTVILQVTRLIREARFADRRVFTSPDEQARWLGEITTPAEAERLAAFLAGH